MDSKKTVLVTGSNGQLGNEIQVIANQYNNLNFLFHDIQTLDICNFEQLDQLFQNQSINFIVNCAAYTAVDKAESEYDKALHINALGSINLALIAEKYSAKLIHISTDYVFDGKHYLPYHEDFPTNPISAYGRSKWEGECEIEKTKAKSLIIRTSWLYSTFGANFVKTILRVARERQEIKVVFDQIGSPTNAADLAKAILDIVNQSVTDENNFKTGIYHYANEGVCSWYDFAFEVIKFANISCKVIAIETKYYPTPTQRPAYSVFNKSKIKQTFGIEIPHWRQSLKNCVSTLLAKQ